jgi:hypothetical protein
MKKLVIFFFFLANGTVLGQMITAPTPLTFEANATNVDPGNFVVNWVNNTEQILVSVSLDSIVERDFRFLLLRVFP